MEFWVQGYVIFVWGFGCKDLQFFLQSLQPLMFFFKLVYFSTLGVGLTKLSLLLCTL